MQKPTFKGLFTCLMNIDKFIYRFEIIYTINSRISYLIPQRTFKSLWHSTLNSITNKNRPTNHKNITSKMATSLFTRIVASSVSIADRSGDIIRDVMKGGQLKIVDKGINDLQTEADRRVQRCIVASLHAKFPDVTVIGEEEEEKGVHSDWVEEGESQLVFDQSHLIPASLQDVPAEDICVWVDPLDGTNEYTKGYLDHVTVLIGIAVRGKAVAGIIHHPYFNHPKLPDCGCHDDSKSGGDGGDKVGRTVWGVVGLGSFGLASRPPCIHGDRRIVTTRSHETELVRTSIQACQATDVIKIGGAGYKVLYMMEGGAEAYVYTNPGSNKWDTCAPEALLAAAGGCMTDVTGTPMKYFPSSPHANKGGIVATTTVEGHRWYIEKIPEGVKKALMGGGV